MFSVAKAIQKKEKKKRRRRKKCSLQNFGT
jgi:hypothetical protein